MGVGGGGYLKGRGEEGKVVERGRVGKGKEGEGEGKGKEEGKGGAWVGRVPSGKSEARRWLYVCVLCRRFDYSAGTVSRRRFG